MIGSLPPELMEKFDNDEVDGHLKCVVTKRFSRKSKYEEAEVVIDLRSYDDDGSLDVKPVLDKNTNRFIPQVRMVSGCLIVTLRREK